MTPLPWSLLPLKCRMPLLEALAHTSSPDKTVIDGRAVNVRQPKTHFAKYAAVCKEWQAFFEPRLYSHLTVSQSCLSMFMQVVRRQRCLLRHLWLRIELTEHTCYTCTDFRVITGQRPGRRLTTRRCPDDHTVERAIWDLFSILSTWRVDRFSPPKQLTLELSLYSPRDSQHCFKGDLHLGADCFGEKDLDSYRIRVSDRAHGWDCGRRRELPPQEAILRLLGSVNATLPSTLTPLDFVTSFLLRRQTRRQISPYTLQQLLGSLPNLVNFDYEPWREYIRGRSGYRGDREFCRADILAVLPRNLKTLTLFEDFNEDYNTAFYFSELKRELPYITEYTRTPSPTTGAALARRSTLLERVSASFIVDANDFFQAREPDWIWKDLKSLTLTSPMLMAQIPSARINEMLMKAGTTALQMPSLETLEIWNGRIRTACVFRYRVAKSQATLGWCGTFDLTMDSDVLDIWKNVSLLHCEHELEVLPHESLAKEEITSHAVAIEMLQLGDGVIHPESQDQIIRESHRWYFQA